MSRTRPASRDRASNPTFGIVIPAHDEEDFVAATLESIANQRDRHGRRADAGTCRIVVVENASSDSTAAVVAEYARVAPVPVTLLRQDEASMVSSRIRGLDYLVNGPRPPEYLVSADADTTFPPTWLAEIAATFARGADLVSSAGFMDAGIWERCPRLTERYLDHVGTIFFDPATVERVVTAARAFPFTEQVFLDFGRPVSDAGFAVTTACYSALGGFRQDYWGDDESSPLPAVGWPLMFRAELAAYHMLYMRAPSWTTSPRRLVNEPEELFTTSAYIGEIASFRATATDQYAWLDRFADRLDLRPLQAYCLKYYVLQRCITRPQLLRRNERYFGPLGDELAGQIHRWHARHTDPPPRAVFQFAGALCDRYADALLAQLPRTRPPARNPKTVAIVPAGCAADGSGTRGPAPTALR